ncbi:hypothetical protein REPUB_Repub07fG0179800 [Reevesia pubescens]
MKLCLMTFHGYPLSPRLVFHQEQGVSMMIKMAAKPLTTEAIALTEKKMDMTLDDIIKMSKNTSNKGKMLRRVPNKSQKPVSNAAKEKAFKVQQYMDSRSSLRQGVLAQRRSNFQGKSWIYNIDDLWNVVLVNKLFCGTPKYLIRFLVKKWSPIQVKVVPILELFFCLSGLDIEASILSAGVGHSIGFDFLHQVVLAASDSLMTLVIGRIGAQPLQRRAANGVFAEKQEQQGNVVTKQRSQTLDSLFANMKEQRMKVFSRSQNNAVQRNGGGRQRMPSGRGRFRN